MKCKHPSRQPIYEGGLLVHYKCDICGKEMISWKRRIAIWTAKYMTLTGAGNSITNFFFGKITSFLQWSVYFFGADYAVQKVSESFLPGLGKIQLPPWVFAVFMLMPVINLISDPLAGWLLKKSGFFAEMTRYGSADKELNPILKEILDNTRKIK